MATELGVGYVSVIPEADGFSAALQRALAGIGQRLGRQMGAEFGDGFTRDAAGRLHDAQGRFVAEGAQTGSAAGGAMGDGVASGLSGGMGALATVFAAGAATAAAAAGAVVAKAFMDAVEVDEGGHRLGAQMGLSDAEAAEAGRVAGDVYSSNFGGSLEEAQTAVGAVMSTLGANLGTGSDALERVTAQALTFADVFSADVEEAASVAGIAIQTGLARDGTHAFDLMTAASQKMPAALRGELLPAVSEYGTYLSSLGITGEEAFGLLATASGDGQIAIDKTGDALKELGIRATDMSAASVAAYDAAGLNAEEMAGRFLQGGDVARGALGDLVSGLQGIGDPVAQANAAIGLFGTPLEDLGTEKVPEFLASLSGMPSALGDVAGAADRAGEQIAQGPTAKIEAFKRRALGGLTAFIGDNVLPGIERFGTVAGDVFGNLGDAFKVGGIEGVLDEVGSLAGKAAGRVGDWIAKEGPNLQARAGELLAHLGDYYLNRYPEILQKIGGLFGRLATWVAEVGFPRMGDALMRLGPALWQWIQNAAPQVLARLGGLWLELQTWLWGTAVPQLLVWGGRLWAALFEWLWTDAVPALLRGLVSLNEAIANWINTTAIPWLRTKAGEWFDKLREMAAEKGAEALAWLKTLPGMIGTWITGTAIPALRAKAAEWFASLRTAAGQKVDDLMAYVRGIPGRVVSAIGDLGRRLLQAGRDLVQGLINGIREKVGDIAGAITGPISGAVDGVKGILGINSPSRVFRQIGEDTMAGFLVGVGNRAGDVIGQMRNVMGDAAQEALGVWGQSGIDGSWAWTPIGTVFEDGSVLGMQDILNAAYPTGLPDRPDRPAEPAMAASAPVYLQVDLDGKKVATAVYDPLSNLAARDRRSRGRAS